MQVRNIEPNNFSAFQNEMNKLRSDYERTLQITYYYMHARFNISAKEFVGKYSVDGANDGGIDCFYKEGNTFYIVQSKYHHKCQREAVENINAELNKIESTIFVNNPNRKIEGFINELKHEMHNPNAYLEIIWLTTNEVTGKVRHEVESRIDKIKELVKNWNINTDLNFIDRYALEGVIYDVNHGYVPHTGKQTLALEPGEYMRVGKEQNQIEAVVCNIYAKEILGWFKSSDEIVSYLQKNVRESVGDKTPINKAIRESYKNDSSLFWYKHNGIIIFADSLAIDDASNKVSIRNPQIVNGGQTITQLYKAYAQNKESANSAKLLVRIYRLPYEDSETYKRSIDIIAALNSQNKIKASDLHSTDPRQVMLENRLNELGSNYVYFRKRGDHGRISSPYNIFMTRLALYYFVCENKRPDEGIVGEIEGFFEEEAKYNSAFPESQIKKSIAFGINHIVIKYIECWNLFHLLNRKVQNEVTEKQKEYFTYVSWYLMVDIYQQIQNWKEHSYSGSLHEWIEFLDSSEYNSGIIKYSKKRIAVYISMLPKKEIEPRNFYKSSEAKNKFLKNSGGKLEFKRHLAKAVEVYRKRISK